MKQRARSSVGSAMGRARAPSVADVAAAAEVSIATVSRLINSPHLVAPETAARVQQAIKDLGYRPNRLAQGLMTRQSRVVGIMLPDIHGEFYSELLRGANTEARAQGYHLLVAAGGDEEHPEEAMGAGPLGLIDGLALMFTEPNDRLWQVALKTGLPVVTLDVDPGEPGVDSILIDNRAGAREAAEHLLESVPPDRCYFVGGPHDNFDTAHRAEAFLAALVRAGHRPRNEQAQYGVYAPDWGRAWAAQILDRARASPIGVLAGNDEIAFGIMAALQAAALTVPRDARIVGFDDSRLASLVHPALSTVRVPRAEVGAAAIQTLLKRIRDPAAPASSWTLPTRLVIRETSRP